MTCYVPEQFFAGAQCRINILQQRLGWGGCRSGNTGLGEIEIILQVSHNLSRALYHFEIEAILHQQSKNIFLKASSFDTRSNKQWLIMATVSVSGKAITVHLSHFIVCLSNTSLCITYLAFMQACTFLMN